ncbi:MAG TPA: TonB-dependent receptor [Candidatus Alistipes stercoripullorum]|nr:TonB-dependent receptor [Candidatus Alistipes stercoripullorum]
MFRSFVLLLGLMSVTELSANPDLSALESGMDAPTPAPQGGGRFALTGKVLDETGAGIPGASVVVKGSTRGVTTDVDGSFEFEVAAADVLQISYLGYETQEITVGAQTNITVQLKPQVSELETVTVVAYGKQRKESIIGAINTIDTDELRVQSGQLSSNLAGKLAGVVVMQRSGEPGKSADFWIRGVNTFGENNKPLILVDGIEREMDLVDVDDIASLSILKDATATALYGVRGANGIVLITTKRGSEGAAKVSVKAEFGLTQPVKVPEMANAEQWIDYYNEISTYEEGSIKPIDDYQKQMYLSGADPDLYPNVDWMDTIYKNLAMTGRVNVSASGGNKNVRYYVGGSYYTEGGMFNMADNNNYDAQMNFNRFSFRSNIDINITKSTELGLSLSTQYTNKNQPGGMTDFYAYAMRTTPISNPTIYSDGTLAVPPEGGGAVNVYNMLNYQGYSKNNRTMAQSLISLTQDFSDIITEGLKMNVKFSWDIDSNNTVTRKYNPNAYWADGRDDQGNLMFRQIQTGTGYMSLDYVYPSGWTTTNFEASATYDRVFADDHRVGALFLFNMRSKSMLRPTSYIESWPYRNIGIAGRVTYAFRDKYFAEFNFGYNGSENFAPGKRFGFFPSYAIGYMISNESFWEPLRDKINILKIRASYGTIGNDQIGGSRRFAYNTTLETGAYGFNFGTNAPASHTPPVNGITTKDYGNPDVTWEEATKADVGIELGLYDMLRIQADYFYEKREGIFIQRESQPSVVGTRVQQYVNLGRMRNQGFDMSLEFDKNINKDLWISARGNFTYNRTKKLYDDKPNQIWKYQNKAGFANNQQFGLIAEGLFESEEDIANSPKQDFGTVRVGDIKYRDINGDGVVNTFDQVAIGYTTVPEINYGFGVSLGWKGLDVSVFFSGVGHVTRIIGGYNLYGGASSYIRQGQIFADVAKNRWSLANPDPNAKYPRMSTTRMENNLQKSTYWQRDMSFLRLKNAEIGYTLPKAWTKKAGLSTVRFYLQGVNLLTFSDFDLWDPELEADYGNQYPTVRTVTLGVNLNF